MKHIKSKKEIIQYANQEFEHTYEEYNEQNQLILSEEKSALGELVERIHYDYNEQGLLETESFAKESGVYQTYHFTYDDQGHITQMVIDYDNGGKEFHKYTRTENQEELTVSDGAGNLEKRELRLFNDHGDVISLQVFDEENKLSAEEKYTFDDQHRVTSKTWKNDFSSGHHTHTYEIDEDGDAVKHTFDAKTNELVEIETSIDKGEIKETIREVIDAYTVLKQIDKSNRTETIEVEGLDEELVESQHTEFDEEGNPLRVEIFDVKGLGQTHNGEKDQHMVKVYEYTFWEKQIEG
ncbi:MAG: hypothetical protein ACPGJS_02895 [Flammeovirgaceae bacterium]